MVYSDLSPAEIGAAAGCFAVLSVVLSGTRLWMRSSAQKRWGVHDWLIIPATIFTFTMSILVLVGVGTGALGTYTPPEFFTQAPTDPYPYRIYMLQLTLWLSDLMQVLGLGCMKLSVMFYYRAIFSVKGQTKLFNFTSWAFIGLTTIWMLAFFFVFIFLCGTRTSADWTSPYDTKTYCLDTTETVVFLLTYAWSDFAMDVILLVFPIPLVLNLQMPTRRKVAVMLLFALGACNIVVSCLRAVFWMQLLSSYQTVYDMAMLYSNSFHWIMIETGFALCTINLPLLYGLRHQNKTVSHMINSMMSGRSLLFRSRESADVEGGSRSDSNSKLPPNSGDRSLEMLSGQSKSPNDIGLPVQKYSDSQSEDTTSRKNNFDDGSITVTHDISVSLTNEG